MEDKKHFVLVHGACHGAWCWYKLAALLNSAGHRVTAPDLAASGISTKPLSELKNVYDYYEPLMEIMASLPSDEKIILVGHSLGGVGLSLAMERFPEKIGAAVFVAAFMMNYKTRWSTIMEKILRSWASNHNRTPPKKVTQHQEHRHSSQFPTNLASLDNKITAGFENQQPTLIFGPDCLSSLLYQRCKPEDLTLAKMLVRPINMYDVDVTVSKEKYGLVNRVYIVCNEDKIMNEDYQRWLIHSTPVNEVMVIDGSDHMAILSKPTELCHCLLEIAKKYA